MKRLATAGLATLGLAITALSGCATNDRLDAGLSGLVGQPVDAAIARLGEPDMREPAEATTRYIWSHEGVAEQTDISAVWLDGYGGRDVRGPRHECTIEIITDRDDEIVRYLWDGDLTGCAHYARRFEDPA